jgi:ApbE superfamily uncharacterized protein (UPF0280 family)
MPQGQTVQSSSYRIPLPSSAGAIRARLPDGRWHFQHGPIDLIIGLDGDATTVEAAGVRMWERFQTVLMELVGELKLLRLHVQEADSATGPVARRMITACWPHRGRFITPMAAVAGAVADELIAELCGMSSIRRAFVNNGGDIALHLMQDQRYRVGLVSNPGQIRWRTNCALDGDFEINWDTQVRGIATSGWRGRSFSLGIADSVTVLARTAAEADASATMIANAVNVEDMAIMREPASHLKDDTDLGDRLVTVEVGALSPAKVDEALDAGQAHARHLLTACTISGAVICLQGRVRVVGDASLTRSALALGKSKQ